MGNHNFKTPTGQFVVGGTTEMERVFKARHAFAVQYCAEQGWDMDNIDIKQLIEVRAQDGWKNAGR